MCIIGKEEEEEEGQNVTSALKIRVMKSMIWAVFQYGVEGWTLKNMIEIVELSILRMWVLEEDAWNFLEITPYQYINIRRDWSGKGVNGEGGSDETTVGLLWTCYHGKCRKFGTDILGGQCRWFTSLRKTQKTVDGQHRRVECL